MSGQDWLRAQAAECHRLAVARGKYPPSQFWSPMTGHMQVKEELDEWEHEAMFGSREREVAEYGDLLATVLSIGHHRGIDPDAALAGAIQRNRERIEEGV